MSQTWKEYYRAKKEYKLKFRQWRKRNGNR